jgi:predicted N-acetyltransferase YhbS
LIPQLVSELPEHHDVIEGVLDRAFGPGRFVKTSERVRERGARFEPGLSRVALNADNVVIGCSRIWCVAASGVDFYFLGPLAVEPGAQHHGLGASLARASVAACRAAAGAGIVLVGAQSFFAPMGFTIIPEGRLELPGPVDPARFLWLQLRPGGFDRAHGLIGPPR